jgi:hypothetical protein
LHICETGRRPAVWQRAEGWANRPGGTTPTHAGSPGRAPRRPRSPALPPRAAEANPGRREAWPARKASRQPWPRWWSTRGSRAATTAATATPGRARHRAVSVRSSGLSPIRGRRPLRPGRPFASCGGREGEKAAPQPIPASLPHSSLPRQFPLPSPPSGSLTLTDDGSPSQRRNGNSGKPPSVKMARAASAARGSLPGWASGSPSGFARASEAPGRRRAALWGAGGGGGGVGGGVGPGGGALAGLRPWLRGTRFRPASLSISRARTSTAVAIARTSRAVAPMVSEPGAVAPCPAPSLGDALGRAVADRVEADSRLTRREAPRCLSSGRALGSAGGSRHWDTRVPNEGFGDRRAWSRESPACVPGSACATRGAGRSGCAAVSGGRERTCAPSEVDGVCLEGDIINWWPSSWPARGPCCPHLFCFVLN